MYELLYGIKPFQGGTIEEIFWSIKNSELEFPDDEDISDECKDFLRQLLQKNPDKRMHLLEEVQQHPFFKDYDWNNIFRKTAYYVPPMLDVNTAQTDAALEPVTEDVNWVDMIINEQNPIPNVKKVNLDGIDE